MTFRASHFAIILFAAAVLSQSAGYALAQDETSDKPMECAPVHGTVNELRADTEGPFPAKFERTVCADIVALDQTLVYNRFGSFNPFGMMYALRRDVVSADSPIKSLTADDCDA